MTASRIADVVARTKTGWGASRANYMAELVCERLTGVCAEQFTNAAMAHGTETEPTARTMYEFMTDTVVEQVAFVDHQAIPMSGCSPDGLIGIAGLVEIKCPSSKVHIETLLGSEIDGKYVKQIQWQLACTGRAWCDFVSFDPRMPADMQLFIRRVDRDDKLIADLEREVTAFISEVDETIANLEAKYRMQEAAE